MFYDGAHLRPKNMMIDSAAQQLVKCGDVVHQLHVVRLGRKTLVDFQDGHDALLIPKVVRSVGALYLPVHRIFE